MGLMKNFFSQTRKPEGALGKMMLSGMNSGHAKLADWGFEHLPKLSPKQAADLGCGAGRNAGELLKKISCRKGHSYGLFRAICTESQRIQSGNDRRGQVQGDTGRCFKAAS